MFPKIIRWMLWAVAISFVVMSCALRQETGDDESTATEQTIVCKPGCPLDEPVDFINGAPPDWCTEWAPNAGETCRLDEKGGITCRSLIISAKTSETSPFPRCTQINVQRLQDPNSKASWNVVYPDFVKNGFPTGAAAFGRKCQCAISAKKYGYGREKTQGPAQPDWCLTAHNGCHFIGAVVARATPCVRPSKYASCTVLLGKKEDSKVE